MRLARRYVRYVRTLEALVGLTVITGLLALACWLTSTFTEF